MEAGRSPVHPCAFWGAGWPGVLESAQCEQSPQSLRQVGPSLPGLGSASTEGVYPYLPLDGPEVPGACVFGRNLRL